MKKNLTPRAVPRQPEVTNLSNYCRESTPFDKPRRKARVLAFKNRQEPRFQVGDFVICPDWDSAKQVTSVKTIIGDVHLIGLDGSEPTFTENQFQRVWRAYKTKGGKR